ncbi:MULTISPECIES: 2-amino-4-hydroxy-6-hydroxymethyldihydropteridine diphosphokinase [unclassified Paenibacillus]|uniref:2-amino-4-hydroxy-6- hydroxymethyldihydropteridine diphosphokinase n=1 Tax=unclassified Paenibacillus TaxID=185978 RepID=UPI00105279F0|nr:MULTISPECIES: 2-amino-4-hydroxy-6-hydroxymethyldihydropteridine diphosphokinase [unclassified Paenibacillus]NIK72156.1 2-amino-4-hydroxy-6-hydroxymethyldihydropteridine diphosphokinase [Paenibacillus sp. BK720]TCM88612.1 2-amino-4-hydroxy-6-hydroxymethyldihydropteridine diphosphokinase [Paenibacillus sp. BK033]
MGVLSVPNIATQAYIALGSNLNDREGLLRQAVEHLRQQPGVQVLGISGIYETAPVGYTDQPAFLNMAMAVLTTLSPIELLHVLFKVEQLLGRVRDIRWGPRTIDLDLLLYGDVAMDGEELTLPHPRMMERAFVLVPLADVIDPSHPLQDLVSASAAAALQDGKEGITLWKITNWLSGSGHSGS